MDIRTLLENNKYTLIAGSLDADVNSVEFDSRKIVKGSAFVAVKGFTVDGHDFVSRAADSGASLIVIEDGQDKLTEDELIKINEKTHATIVSVPDSRKASAYVPAAFFDHPEKKLDMIGVTGTKGKTTITFMLHKIMSCAGRKSGLIGTVCNMYGDRKVHAEHTTPEARDVYELLSDMADDGEDTCIMEVSSQGLKLDRVYGIKFNEGCFTNLYEDHIGGNEHPDMKDYFECKLKLFERTKSAVINRDIPVYEDVLVKAKAAGCDIVTYGLTEGCDVYAYNLKNTSKDGKTGTSFNLNSPWGEGEFFVAIPGKFNVYNALCAIAASGLEGISLDAMKAALADIKVPGRLQHVDNNLGITILVDYAHNAASLENVLDTLKECSNGRLITVFGCGGDRSHTRRFEMGEVSGNKSDYTVITSDNPRTEDPEVIISHIVTGIKKTDGEYETVTDRRSAIRRAIEMSNPGDVVLIAGKGHEDYQIFKDETIHFDDSEVAFEEAKAVAEAGR